METLTKKMSGSSLELRTSPTLPSIPVPDYDRDIIKHSPKTHVTTRVAKSSERDVWGHVERYRGDEEGDGGEGLVAGNGRALWGTDAVGGNYWGKVA